MLAFIMLIQMSFGDWQESDRKDNYVDCLKYVGDFKYGFLEDPVLAHDTCICLVHVVEAHVPEPTNEALADFIRGNGPKFSHCFKEHRARKGLPVK